MVLCLVRRLPACLPLQRFLYQYRDCKGSYQSRPLQSYVDKTACKFMGGNMLGVLCSMRRSSILEIIVIRSVLVFYCTALNQSTNDASADCTL